MITTAILYLLYYAISLVLSPLLLFSDVVLPPQFTDALTSAGASLGIVSVIAPVGTIAAVIVVFAVVEGFIFGYKIIKWVYTKIPGVN